MSRLMLAIRYRYRLGYSWRLAWIVSGRTL